MSMRTRRQLGLSVVELLIVFVVLALVFGALGVGCSGCTADRVSKNANRYCQTYVRESGLGGTCQCMGIDSGPHPDGYVSCTVFSPPHQPSQIECRANAFFEWDTGCRISPRVYRRGQYDVNTDAE